MVRIEIVSGYIDGLLRVRCCLFQLGLVDNAEVLSRYIKCGEKIWGYLEDLIAYSITHYMYLDIYTNILA